MDIGLAIRTIRKQKQITIMQLCEGTGLSKGFISNVENNKTSPSIATLESIADYLGVPLPYLLLTSEQRMNVVRKHERKETTAGSGQIKVQQLTAKGAMRMSIVELPAGASTGISKHAGKRAIWYCKVSSKRSRGKMWRRWKREIRLHGTRLYPMK